MLAVAAGIEITGVDVPVATETGAVPETEVTVPPVFEDAIVMPPALLVMVTFEPAVNVVRVNPVPLPISSAPLAGVVVKPVPPLAIGKVPVTPVVSGSPVVLVSTPDAGVPKAGVTSVGEVDSTTDPDPVEVVAPVPPLPTATIPVTFADVPETDPAIWLVNVFVPPIL